ncbi:MAG TPA: vitamin B12-dependent ribonucleotide reductase, partial [Candidatus Angelobacter sp.]|nr:vitamin B12-dependent ribonucleotide reductase [Candidatus Angelobacter sp.]
IGYANLGALLMATGHAYDSEGGRAIAAAITSLMTASAYKKSAELAGVVGPYAGYGKNAEAHKRVIRKHAAASDQVRPVAAVERDILALANRTWQECIKLGTDNGYRNAQASLLAPTGTIGFMMDCDTTGIEPDLALIKYKKLVGGGMIKIVNNTVPLALWKLGYSGDQVNSIVSYIDSTGTIEGAPGVKDEHLPVFDCSFKPQKGTRSISYMGHIKMMAAAQPFISGAISKTVNLPEAASVEDIMEAYIQSWKLGLKAVAIYRDGSKKAQPLMAASSKDEAAKRGTKGEKAVAALSPADQTWAALAPEQKTFALEVVRLANGAASEIQGGVFDAVRRLAGVSREDQETAPPRALRHRLPLERASLTHKFSIAGHEGYITVGLYKDGTPGELFIRMAKEGSTVSGLMDSFATAVSLALQHGVPLRLLCDKFEHTRFEPSGFTGNQQIPIAKSVMDYIFRWLEIRFVSGQQFPLFKDMIVAPAAGEPRLAQPAMEAQQALLMGAETTPPQGGLAHGQAPAAKGYEPGTPHLEDRGIYHAADAMRDLVDMGDAPSCHVCGAIMTRNGSCYRCMSCGSTSGCS